MSKEYKLLTSLFPVTLVGLITSVILFESQWVSSGTQMAAMSSKLEFGIYLAGIFSLSVEACKAAGNSDASVITDQITSLSIGILVLVFYVIGMMQMYGQTQLGYFSTKYERILFYKPFMFSCVVVWLDVFNGFIIGRFNRSR